MHARSIGPVYQDGTDSSQTKETLMSYGNADGSCTDDVLRGRKAIILLALK